MKKSIISLAVTLPLLLFPSRASAHFLVPFNSPSTVSWIITPFCEFRLSSTFPLFRECPNCGMDDWEYFSFGDNYIEYKCNNCEQIIKISYKP
jgi:hypothetical protein